MSTWTYEQHTGAMLSPTGVTVEIGYSGADEWVNKPIAERIPDEGPIPTGSYTIEPAVDHANLGPCSMPLTPDPANEMHDRFGFYIHGDNAQADQSASAGCIIMSRETRDEISASTNRTLLVVI